MTNNRTIWLAVLLPVKSRGNIAARPFKSFVVMVAKATV